MKVYTFAFFLTVLFFAVAGFGAEPDEGFSQNPEYVIPQPAPAPAAPASAVPASSQSDLTEDWGDRNENPPVWNPPDRKNNSYSTPGTAYLRRSSASANQSNRFVYATDPVLRAWLNRQSPVPTGLPRVNAVRSSFRCSGFRRFNSVRSSSVRNSLIKRSSSCGSCSRTVTVKSCCGK